PSPNRHPECWTNNCTRGQIGIYNSTLDQFECPLTLELQSDLFFSIISAFGFGSFVAFVFYVRFQSKRKSDLDSNAEDIQMNPLDSFSVADLVEDLNESVNALFKKRNEITWDSLQNWVQESPLVPVDQRSLSL